MIKTKAKAQLLDQDGINNLDFEVNWDPNRKDLIKVILANKVSVIKRDDLWNFVFSIVEADKQQKMVPISKTDFESYKKQHEIILQKDMLKGETVVAHCTVNVRQEVVDSIKRDLEAENSYPQKDIKTPYLTDNKDSV